MKTAKEDKKAESDISFSVLMSVYKKDKAEYLDLALKSIYDDQTVKPAEIVVIFDGPLTDELYATLEDFKKGKEKIVKYFPQKENRGLGLALREGVTKCSHDYIARMDADDISLPDRFEKQLKALKKTNADIIGGNIDEYNEDMSERLCARVVPESNDEIVKFSKKRNPMNHMTVFYKKQTILDAGNYEDVRYFEDYFLWLKCIKNGAKFFNIQDILVKARGGEDMLERRGGKKYIAAIKKFYTKAKADNLLSSSEIYRTKTIRKIVAFIPDSIRKEIYKKKIRQT